jgi:hypothetical protein
MTNQGNGTLCTLLRLEAQLNLLKTTELDAIMVSKLSAIDDLEARVGTGLRNASIVALAVSIWCSCCQPTLSGFDL